MIKSLAWGINFLVVLVLTNILGGVSITQNIPEKVNAGDQFTISITIDKGNIGDFGRLQMTLPNGFEAKAKESSGGSFNFENQKVRLQWITMPYEDRFTVSFDVIVPRTVSGEFQIQSDFSYIKDNNPAVEELPAHTLKVKGSESEEDLTASNTYNYKGVRMKEIDCIRQKPYLNENDEIIVNLLVVNKTGINEFGKIQEQIPRGYKAISLRSKNAMFTNNGRIIKFMWMQFPTDEHFVVTYKLIQTEKIPNQAFIVKGEMTYTRNGRNQVIDIKERNIDLEEFTEEELVVDKTPLPEEKDKTDLLDSDDQIAETQTPGTTEESETETSTEAAEAETLASEEAQTEKQSTREQTTTEGSQTYTQYTDKESQKYKETNYAIAVEKGITYRVQVAAGHKLVSDAYFERKKLKEKVQIEIHQGWHKYTVGSHHIYKKARDHRNNIWNTTPIDDAFVCAYNNGQRITVQEALMIANQKWYK